MEEDIIDKLELLIMETKESAFPTYWSKENAELVENLIKGYKELKEKNKKQKEHIENINKRNSNQRRQLKRVQEKLQDKTYKFLCDNPYIDTFDIREVIMLEEVQKNYIPKSKVREKIEELEKFIESKRILPVDIIEDQNRNVKWKIEALQELLEGDK